MMLLPREPEFYIILYYNIICKFIYKMFIDIHIYILMEIDLNDAYPLS